MLQTTFTMNDLLAAVKNSPIAANRLSEITLFTAGDIEGMEGVRQCMAGVLNVNGTGIGYYMFAVFSGSNEDALHLYNFIVLENNQIFHIHNN